MRYARKQKSVRLHCSNTSLRRKTSSCTISEYGAFDLEEGVDSGAGKIVLNGTDGSSTNAGNRIRFEPATDDNINFNYPRVAA